MSFLLLDSSIILMPVEVMQRSYAEWLDLSLIEVRLGCRMNRCLCTSTGSYGDVYTHPFCMNKVATA